MINRNQLIFIFFIKHQLNCWLVNFLSGDRWLWEWIGDRCLIYFLGVAIANPLKVEIQADGRMRCWAKIEENEGRYLRVILLEDGETVHNAFFDRNFKELET